MSAIFHHMTMMHRMDLFLAAAAVCLIGSIITVRLIMRARQSSGTVRRIQIALCGLIGGTTIWATHFVAMLAFEPGVPFAYDVRLTGLSLVIAILGVSVAAWMASMSHKLASSLLAGLTFGGTLGLMHFGGMKAYLVAGQTGYDTGLWWAALLASCGFAILMFQRINWPNTRLCWLGASLAMVLSVCSVHFIGMAAYTITPDPSVSVPNQRLPAAMLGGMISAVVIIMLMLALSVLSIESHVSKQARTMLADAGLRDALTDLPNRQFLDERLVDWSRRIESFGDGRLILILADLARFKRVNDAHGHKIGDHVLQVIAHRLSRLAGPDTVVARIGGDEFACLTRTKSNDVTAESLSLRLQAEMKLPITRKTLEIRPSPRLGYAIWPDDTEAASDLIAKATLALQVAKTEAADNIQAFDPVSEAELRRTADLVHDLSQAIDRDELVLNFQRQNRMSDEALIGFEVLLRWQHPEHGLISPAVFIPLAESTGLICEIGMWVLHRACCVAAGWTSGATIAVNVAPQQLVQTDFVSEVARILEETGFDPKRLELEITEASIVDDEENTLRVMMELRTMGIRIAMDDFGTGYSSLAMLQKFPFDLIKIDRSFIAHVHETPLKAAIVKATLLLGETLKIPVLAEGIEEIEELAFLNGLGCAVAQGFYFGKPMTQEEAELLVSSQTIDVAIKETG